MRATRVDRLIFILFHLSSSYFGGSSNTCTVSLIATLPFHLLLLLLELDVGLNNTHFTVIKSI